MNRLSLTTMMFAAFACAISCAVIAENNSTKLNNIVQPQMIKIAEKRVFFGAIEDDESARLSAKSLDESDRKKISIHRPGASFIKIHFSDFNIPHNSHVIVSSPTGDQQYEYGINTATPKTVDTQAGDNGITSFSAMSIEGDTAIVSYQAQDEDAPYSVNIDYIMEGFPQETIEAVLSESPALAEGDSGIFSTCGINERRDVQCWKDSHPTEFERTRPVARLLINGSSLCTAWRVGEQNRMFTNNHCVSTQSAVQNTEVWFNYQRSACGGGSTSATTKVSGTNMLNTNRTLDYTLFEVSNFSSISQFGNFGLELRNANLNERIYIPQHGSGNPKELAIASDQNQGGVCRVDDDFINGYGTNTDIGYYCDTIGGSSGSPVLAATSNKVIALHHFGGCLNQGVRIAAIWPQVSQYFNGVPSGDGGDGDGGGGDDGETPNSGQITNLSGNQGEWKHYTIDIPPGTSNLRVALSGGRGDADIYVRRGARPTINSYNCRPYLNGNSETCSIDNPASGTWHYSINAYRTYSGATLTWNYR